MAESWRFVKVGNTFRTWFFAFFLLLCMVLSSASEAHASGSMPEESLAACAATMAGHTTTLHNRSKVVNNLRELDPLVDLLIQDSVDTEALEWVNLLNTYIKPAVSTDVPILSVAFVGRTNTGKTTAFEGVANMLGATLVKPSSGPVSRISIDPGSTRRLTLLASESLGSDPLVKRFGGVKSWENPDDSTTEGVPIVVTARNFPDRIVFIDTPGIESIDLSTPSSSATSMSPMRSLNSAEVLVYVFSMHEVGDPYHLSMVQEAFKRWGHRKIILVFNVNPAVEPADAIRQIESVGRRFDSAFEISMVGSASSPIIGAYLMPQTTQVFRGEESAVLTPVAGTLPFPQMVNVLNRNVEAIWENVFNETIRRVAEAAKEQLTEISKARLEIALLRNVIRLMVLDASRYAIHEFPYFEARDTLQSLWRDLGSDMSRSLRDMSDWTARPEKKLLTGRFLGATARWARHEALMREELRSAEIEGVQNQEEVRILSALNRFGRAFREGALIIDPSHTTEPERAELIEEIIEIGRHLERLDPRASVINEVQDGGLRIDVGSYSQYPETVQRAIGQINSENFDRHAPPLLTQLSQIMPPLTGKLTFELVKHLKQVRRNKNFMQRALDQAIPQLHWMIPGSVLAAEFWQHYHARFIQLNPFAYMIPANLAARLVHGIDRRYIDHILFDEVQRWSSTRQRLMFSNYLGRHVLGDLTEAIKHEEIRLTFNDNKTDFYMGIIDDLLDNAKVSRPLQLEDLRPQQRPRAESFTNSEEDDDWSWSLRSPTRTDQPRDRSGKPTSSRRRWWRPR